MVKSILSQLCHKDWKKILSLPHTIVRNEGLLEEEKYMLILWEGEEDQIATPRGTGPGVYKHFWDQISYQGYSLGP